MITYRIWYNGRPGMWHSSTKRTFNSVTNYIKSRSKVMDLRVEVR